MTLGYWQNEDYYLGKLLEHLEIMTLGRTIDELTDNITDAYKLMVLEDVPINYQTKEMSIRSI